MPLHGRERAEPRSSHSSFLLAPCALLLGSVPAMTAVDVEALHPSPDSRSARLGACLLVSVGALFVCVLGVSVAVTLLVLRIQGELDTLRDEEKAEPDKVQNSAHLESAYSYLDNSTLRWTAKNLGSRFSYSTEIHALEVLHRGMYLMYLNLGVRCPHEAQRGCEPTSVVVSVNSKQSTKLECTMSLPKSEDSLKVHHCLAVMMLDRKEQLLIDMKVLNDSRPWKLEQDRTTFGLIPVEVSTA